MRWYLVLFTTILLPCGCETKREEIKYIEQGTVKKISPAIPWNKTIGSTDYLGTGITFERDSGEVVKIVVWGDPPVWENLHCRVFITNKCEKSWDIEQCGDFVEKIEVIK